jgi:RNA methyltransferase, TrmH family
MLSKNRIKYIHSLDLKKNRIKEQAFIAEGHKSVDELLKYFKCKLLIANEDWWNKQMHDTLVKNVDEKDIVTQEDLARASLLKTPQDVLAVFSIPNLIIDITLPSKSLCLALDKIQNPGNLGTIIRLADWFGIETIYCSLDCADVFSPKTVQATMGALGRVSLYYTPLPEFMSKMEDVPIYATSLDGKNLYSEKLENHGLIVMGNEGNGISPEVKRLITKHLYIPNYPIGRETSESLNVAIATGIVCAEFRRRII